MSNLGAIPKVKGGARPKTKVVSNGQISENFKVHQTNSYQNRVGDSINNSVTAEFNTKTNRYNRKSFSSSVPDDNEHSLSFQEARTSSEPLEQREIFITDDGVQIKRPALSPTWVEKRIFIHYIRPPLPSMDSFVEGATDAWVEQMEFLIDDLNWLLSLPHHRFWSQVIFDKSVQECLEAYLSSGPRWYDSPAISQDPDSSVSTVINEIHQGVFLVYLRLSTYKESKEDFISPNAFANLIYDNFLYDICKCLDLCVLYEANNRPLLKKMIANIFQVQPKYYEDLALLVDTLKNVLDTLEQKLGIYDPTLPRSFSAEPSALTLDELQDIIRYIQDTFCSVHAFLSIFPEACHTFHHKEFALRVSAFYGKAIPKLLELLYPDEEEEDGEEERLLRQQLGHDLATTRVNALAVFRDVLAWSCLRHEASTEKPTVEAIGKGVESFTHILTSCLEDRVFVVDYSSAFGLEQDIAYFQEKGADMTPVNFVKEAVETILNEMNLPSESVDTQESSLPHQKHSSDTVDDTSGMNGYYVGETCSLSDVEITSLVSSIKDLLPDLGDGFVKECLKYYNYSTEETLNALLEGKLPPVLDALDRSLKDTALRPQEQRPSPVGTPDKPGSEENGLWEGPLYNRLNVYDDDEFDVFRRPTKFDKSKVHRGKARTADSAGAGLEKDPELANKLKQILRGYEASAGYSIYEDEEKYSPQEVAMTTRATDYDDEYDDTYDDNEAGDIDGGYLDLDRRRRAAGSFISMRGRGALNTPGMNFVEEEDEKDEEENPEAEGDKIEPPKEGAKERRPPPVNKFKRANASYRRGDPSSYGDWDPRGGRGNSLVFTNSTKRGGGNRSGGGGRADEEGTEEHGASSRDGEQKQQEEPKAPRATTFEPFCENPQETRRRQERKKQALQFRNKGTNYHQPARPNQQPASGNSREEAGFSSESGPTKFYSKTSKHSGKSWRQGTQGEDSDRRPQGGKYKEDTNHGKAQDKNYRYKMMHKNEQRRNAAQAKYRNNF